MLSPRLWAHWDPFLTSDPHLMEYYMVLFNYRHSPGQISEYSPETFTLGFQSEVSQVGPFPLNTTYASSMGVFKMAECGKEGFPDIPVSVATTRAFLWCSHLSLSSLLPSLPLLLLPSHPLFRAILIQFLELSLCPACTALGSAVVVLTRKQAHPVRPESCTHVLMTFSSVLYPRCPFFFPFASDTLPTL